MLVPEPRLALAFVVLLTGCKSEPAPQVQAKPDPKPDQTEQAVTNDATDPATNPTPSLLAAGPDPHSFSRPDQVRVVHVGLNWVVDFDAQTLTGDAVLLLDRVDKTAPLVLDSRDLDIKQAYAMTLDASPGPLGAPELGLDQVRNAPGDADAAGWVETSWEVGNTESSFGAPIFIDLPPEANAVKLRYATRPGATGLQWLEAQQTAGKQASYLYSQSQAIHARSWMPSQDSPGVRATWDAVVVVPRKYTAVMAAEQLGELSSEAGEAGEAGDGATRAFRFVMPQKVPAYLIALAVGDLERREVGPRTAVWADPTVVAAAADEFADMEAMLTEAEHLYGDYAWGRYDVLVLPPAFPFGGMENPRLTFLTPTLLAGDRSLVSVIAHELAHSWSGNLVTNKTWGDLWLNEGFTVYFERRIIEQIYGTERAAIEAVIGKRELVDELTDPEQMGDKPDFQRLAQDLRGIDPDQAFSGVPYEKGALLLVALEHAYGREVFDEFLRKWFTTHAFGSVSTPDFIDFVGIELVGKHPVLDGHHHPPLAEWIDGAGLPDDAPEPSAEPLDLVQAEAERFGAGELQAKEIRAKGWTPWHWLHFLRSLPPAAGAEQMGELDQAFELTKSSNAEILGEWLEMAARHRYEPAYARMESFLIEVGRRKFLTPIYRALTQTPEGWKQANAIYAKARPGYHSISRATLDSLLRVP
ncbi:M1 family metallopeptidase [Enhygromyxa salina]|uniref:Aminopeptidase N n=1 Tax=Enhygromyxa salina TaxID=215803 RepID=A0A2S9XUJ2_9BACT|nr:M1 family metallopeptidase [Enhygromyxa salina]PRP96381.1 Aminopeptidase N [Enhygromyxa salina]